MLGERQASSKIRACMDIKGHDNGRSAGSSGRRKGRGKAYQASSRRRGSYLGISSDLPEHRFLRSWDAVEHQMKKMMLGDVWYDACHCWVQVLSFLLVQKPYYQQQEDHEEVADGVLVAALQVAHVGTGVDAAGDVHGVVAVVIAVVLGPAVVAQGMPVEQAEIQQDEVQVPCGSGCSGRKALDGFCTAHHTLSHQKGRERQTSRLSARKDRKRGRERPRRGE